jgi:hypothetical protein
VPLIADIRPAEEVEARAGADRFSMALFRLIKLKSNSAFVKGLFLAVAPTSRVTIVAISAP